MSSKKYSKFKNIKPPKVWEAENIYHLKTNISRISKLIYQYEIYKKIKNVPGDVLEFGVLFKQELSNRLRLNILIYLNIITNFDILRSVLITSTTV